MSQSTDETTTVLFIDANGNVWKNISHAKRFLA